LRGITEGLLSLHALKDTPVHRALNPDAVIVERESGRAILTNFECARLSNQPTVVHGKFYADPYSAPEVVALPRNAEARSDLYSLAAIAYRVAVGKTFVPGEDPGARRLDSVQMPATVQRVFHRCLELDVERRPESARAVLSELGGWR
jgi:serine/threonine-protein kinase